MAYIQPNSTIRLLQNCPLDKTYDHTIYFASASAQATYFSSLASFTYSNASYVRKNRAIKVQATVGQNLYTCNYLMFKNTSFENKWFYAFITHVEYDNNLTWIIEFELDVMQTWFFDYELERCFVEREHSATDNIGDNLVPEKLELGDYISDGISRSYDGDSSMTDSHLADLSLVFGCTFDRQYNDFKGGYYAGMYSGLCYIDFPFPKPPTPANIQSFVNNIQTWITGASAKINGIITCFVMPTEFIHSDTSSPSAVGFNKPKHYENNGENGLYGFTVQNNKLFTFPYNFLYVTNMSGSSCAYHYEYFRDTNNCGFALQGNYASNPEFVLTPLNYKGVGLENYDERIALSGFPIMPFTNDVYMAWCALDASAQVATMLGTVGAGAAIGSVVPGIGTAVGAGVGLAHSIGSMIGQAWEADIAPPQNHGSTSGAHALTSLRLLDFMFMNKHIRPEFAHIIDNYFSMFGYATHRCKVPNRNVRPHWTYTKTVGCCITGSVPADDMAKICSIYDRGITFWRNGSEVGHYNLNNRPT